MNAVHRYSQDPKTVIGDLISPFKSPMVKWSLLNKWIDYLELRDIRRIVETMEKEALKRSVFGPNAIDDFVSVCLRVALFKNKDGIVEFLIKKRPKAALTQEVLAEACSDFYSLKLFVDALKIDINKFFERRPGYGDSKGRFLLELPVEQDNTECLQYLLDNGADVNGTEAVAMAVKGRSQGCLELLLKSGANVNEMNEARTRQAGEKISACETNWPKVSWVHINVFQSSHIHSFATCAFFFPLPSGMQFLNR